MPAGIEKDDFMFSGSGQMPWHGTNVTVVPGQLASAEAIKIAKLDWKVEVVPVEYQHKGVAFEMPRQFVIVRDSDSKGLGVVGNIYTPLQNERAFQIGDALVGGGDCFWETAGSLKGGRIVYMTLNTPFDVDLPGGDKLKTYLLITNRHDGSGKVTVAVITIRVVCANTLSASLAGAMARYGVKHTTTMEARLVSAEAQHILGLAQGASDRAEEVATKLLSQKMTEAKFQSFLELLVSPGVSGNTEPTPRQLAAAERTRETIAGIYRSNPTQDGIRGTAWGAYNAVTFYNDHATPRREMEGDTTPADQRMLAILAGNNIGDKALDILMDGIGGGRWLTGRSK